MGKPNETLKEDDFGENRLPHIKVTLIQFLRNVPLTDRQNEDLLTIIFSMMEFSDTEMQELKIARLNIRVGKQKPARAASSSVAGQSANSMSKDEDGSGKNASGKRGGLFGGLFNKKKSERDLSQGVQNASGGGGLPPPNLRPLPKR